MYRLIVTLALSLQILSVNCMANTFEIPEDTTEASQVLEYETFAYILNSLSEWGVSIKDLQINNQPFQREPGLVYDYLALFLATPDSFNDVMELELKVEHRDAIYSITIEKQESDKFKKEVEDIE